MIRSLALAIVLAAGTISAVPEQEFILLRSVTGNGGGTSSGGDFRVSGTIGETAAGSQVAARGRFDLAAGFWAGRPAVMWPEPTASRPVPTIRYDQNLMQHPATLAQVSIVPWRPGWQVEYSVDLLTWYPAGNFYGDPDRESAGLIAAVIHPIAGLPRIYWRLVRF